MVAHLLSRSSHQQHRPWEWEQMGMQNPSPQSNSRLQQAAEARQDRQATIPWMRLWMSAATTWMLS